MKKIILILFLVSFIAATGFGIYKWMTLQQREITEVLPVDPLMLIQLDDPKANFEKLFNTPFFQSLEKIDVDRLFQASNTSNESLSKTDELKKMHEFLNDPWISKLLMKQMTVVLYPVDFDLALNEDYQSELFPRMIKKGLSRMLIVLRVDRGLQAAEFLKGLTGFVPQNVTETSTDYRSHQIHRVSQSNNDMDFSYVRIDDLLLLALDEAILKKSLDVESKFSPRITEHPHWDKVKESWLDGAALHGFLDVSQTLSHLKEQVFDIVSFAQRAKYVLDDLPEDKFKDEDLTAYEQQWDKFIKNLSGYDIQSFSFNAEDIAHFRMKWLLDPDQMESFQRELMVCEGSKNKTFSLIPANILMYNWSNCFKADVYWREYVKGLNNMSTAEDQSNIVLNQLKNVETMVGFDIQKDILPLIGEESGLFITDIQVNGLFPLPKMAFFQSMTDSSRTIDLLLKLTENPFMFRQEEQYQNHTIYYMALPLGDMLQPSFTVIDDYLFIGTNRNILKLVLDVKFQASDGFAKSELFNNLNYDEDVPIRSIQYMRPSLMAQKSREVIKWTDQWLSKNEKKQQAFSAGSQRRLDESRTKIVDLRQQIDQMSQRIETLQTDMLSEKKNPDHIAKKMKEYADLETRLPILNKELATAVEEVQDLEKIVSQYENNSSNPEGRRAVLEGLVYPLLEGMMTIRHIGSVSTYHQNSFSTDVYFKTSR